MPLNVSKLIWDTSFFGYPVYKLQVSEDAPFLEHQMKRMPREMKLTYVFSPCELHAQDVQLNLVDIKVIFSKSVHPDRYPGEASLFDNELHSYQQLLKLAHLSGRFSRFRSDPHFSPSSFERLYKTWLDNSLSSSSTQVIVESEGEFITGFVTLEAAEDSKSKIGLIAVDPNFQGRGIGSKLLKNAEIEAQKAGSMTISVATQYKNEQAMRLYCKNGYHISEKSYIYHYWKK